MTDGSQFLRQEYTGGAFTTVEGKSPGACEAGPDTGGTVAAGITGGFGGFTRGTLNCGEQGACAVPSPSSVTVNCPVPNVTACFVQALFGVNSVFKVSTFKFNYSTECGQLLVAREWQNADATNGGNVGDIKSAPGPAATVACAPAPVPVTTPQATPTPTPTVSPSGLPITGPSALPISTARASHLATTGAGSGVPWSGLVLLLGLGLLLVVAGGVMVARSQFHRF
jgi:hypothetical protein